MRSRIGFVVAALALALCVGRAASSAQNPASSGVVAALKEGRHVIVMRHASSPRQVPDKQAANADNVNLERQLDETGRTTATNMGKAFLTLKIPIGEVLVSPTYRAMETVRFAGLKNAKAQPELGDGGQSMQTTPEAQAEWLRKKVAARPESGNTILVTHMPNIARAFPDVTPGAVDGESLVFRPDGKGGAALVGRIKIEEWTAFRP